eukprot:Plantae.Rhodophyta-Hildenbrandia_rubra.ctg4220.p1 GENE.Plantae.Rhodophyta-Hildenbrandia_rubra.ctg4220~~Plantae.Rhodophyta-Hildenbrandia_rubra.ctg4220.p1  ORF type:complete len:501 (+),score=106.81 Plantae.Rhodophyta-Hildenbrandia_rubra.ctg4220:2619-4121(+)
MSSSILESCRAAREDEERSIRLAVRALHARDHLIEGHGEATNESNIPWMVKASDGTPLVRVPLEAEHLARNLIDIARTKCEYVAGAYEAEDIQHEGDAMTAEDDGDALSIFYKRLRELRDMHAGKEKDDNDIGNEVDLDEALLSLARPKVIFSGEEAGGRFFDVHEYFTKFLNLRQGKDEKGLDYLKYLNVMDDFTLFSSDVKKKANYRQYLQGLREYLVGFAGRVRPLGGMESKVRVCEGNAKKELQGKVREITKGAESVDDIEKNLTMDEMKDALRSLSLKYGGTAKQRAQRLYKAMTDEAGSGRIFIMEATILFLLKDVLEEERASTIVNVEKKLSLSYEEIEAERVALENVEQGFTASKLNAGEAKDDERMLDNTKNVPLGWDGRPIPFWLYKLYGLNHEFKCEICGNATYKGPRTFQRHFTDPQHIQGLRCLGISYSKQYYMVTRIGDAKRLREKIENDANNMQFDADIDEEFEDAEGNVMNKKTYGDLVRQGLV